MHWQQYMGNPTKTLPSGMKITSDNHWKQFKYRYEVPKKVLAQWFDYQDEEDTIDGFFKYRGVWYHLDQFMRVPSGGELAEAGWQGYHGDSYFSGVVIKISSDGEEYQVGTYIS